MKKSNNNLEWYDNGYIITDIIIGLILLIIILSQSFAINTNNISSVFMDIINHNSIYLLVLVYFVALKTKIGKKYFDYFNLFLIFVYSIVSITSLLTVFQSFGPNPLFEMALNFIILCYLFHTMLRDTRIWKDFKLKNSPFNELNNEWYFGAIIILSITMLAFGLICTTTVDGAILFFLDCLFNIFLGRYIYLYHDYLNNKKINIKGVNHSNKKSNIEKITKKVDEIIDKTELDEVIEDVKEKFDDFVEDSKLDEKVDEIKDKIEDTKKKVKDYVKDDNSNYKKKQEVNAKESSTKKIMKGDK